MIYSKKKNIFTRTKCSFCAGSGWIVYKHNNKLSSFIKIKCPRCGGKGIYVQTKE